jgi:ribonuclease HI
MEILPRLVVATDGSALRNPNGPAGWCWFANGECWAAGGWPRNTNNAAELTAILEALRATAHMEPHHLVVESDSQYAINCITKWVHGWRRRGWTTAAGAPVKNAELVQAIDAERQGRSTEFRWVRGHSGHARNESADRRAVAAAKAFSRGAQPQPGPGWTLG